MHAQTAVVENGFVHLPETAPWLAEYLHLNDEIARATYRLASITLAFFLSRTWCFPEEAQRWVDRDLLHRPPIERKLTDEHSSIMTR